MQTVLRQFLPDNLQDFSEENIPYSFTHTNKEGKIGDAQVQLAFPIHPALTKMFPKIVEESFGDETRIL